MQLKHYIVVTREGDLFLIGPFTSAAGANAYVKKHWDETVGDPNWRIITLRSIRPKVFDPTTAKVF